MSVPVFFKEIKIRGKVMFDLQNLFGRRSQRIIDFFINAVRVYALKGEEDARCAAIAAVKGASKKQRRSMMESLFKMASNVTRNSPTQLALKPLAERLTLLKEDLIVYSTPSGHPIHGDAAT
jgi:hypothetical protein